MIEDDQYHPGDGLERECLWHRFSELLQRGLDQVTHHWNTHYIRKSGFNVVNGRPDELYFIPEYYGAEDCIESVTQEKLDSAKAEYAVIDQPANIFQEYFQYLMDDNNFLLPSNWTETTELYHALLRLARN